jgi:murein L,D-transpeptidase YafK
VRVLGSRVAALVATASSSLACAEPIRCAATATIVVETRSHRMALCEHGEAIRTLPVAIGGGGTDKRREGDRKTPLGSYGLDPVLPSTKFHRFIGIRYPTADQAARGFTGSAVGIHGPSRKHSWMGSVRNWIDWTDGCIAVATDEEIDDVAAWLARAKARTIEIR